MNLDQLRQAVAAGTVDTVLLAVCDMQGRLQGKRLTARHFLDEVMGHGAEGCTYLLAVDVDMDTVPGYAISSWERGYGDFVFRPDLDTLRPVPWQEATALACPRPCARPPGRCITRAWRCRRTLSPRSPAKGR